MPAIKRKWDRIKYYSKNIILDCAPGIIFRHNRTGFIRKNLRDGQEYIIDRANYYNRLSNIGPIPSSSCTIKNIPINKSMYYYDLKYVARLFPKNMLVNFQFGDSIAMRNEPTIAKARCINDNDVNSVIMKLDKFRHFFFPRDQVRFEDKKPIAVWRGGQHNKKRQDLIRNFKDHPLCDVGFTHAGAASDLSGRFLHPTEQMVFKYVISIEGNDVATNLKWILSSNSLCLMPKPIAETWFMEGRLVGGRHYVQLADDFADLEDKILYYERHPREAKAIIANANAYVDQFFNPYREQAIGLLVMYKYFVATGQIAPDEDFAELVWR